MSYRTDTSMPTSTNPTLSSEFHSFLFFLSYYACFVLLVCCYCCLNGDFDILHYHPKKKMLARNTCCVIHKARALTKRNSNILAFVCNT